MKTAVKNVYEIIKCNTVLHKLFEQQVLLPLNNAYKIYKLKEELTEIENLMFERWNILFGENYNIAEFDEEQIYLYNTTLQTEVEISIPNISLEEIVNNDKAKLSLQDIETLSLFFKDI